MTNKAQQKICCIVVGAVIIEHCCLFFFWFWCIPNLYHSCKWDFIRPHTYKDNGNKSSFIKHKILQANEDIGKYTQRICAEDIGIDFILSTFWWDFKIKKKIHSKRDSFDLFSFIVYIHTRTTCAHFYSYDLSFSLTSDTHKIRLVICLHSQRSFDKNLLPVSSFTFIHFFFVLFFNQITKILFYHCYYAGCNVIHMVSSIFHTHRIFSYLSIILSN